LKALIPEKILDSENFQKRKQLQGSEIITEIKTIEPIKRSRIRLEYLKFDLTLIVSCKRTSSIMLSKKIREVRYFP